MAYLGEQALLAEIFNLGQSCLELKLNLFHSGKALSCVVLLLCSKDAQVDRNPSKISDWGVSGVSL